MVNNKPHYDEEFPEIKRDLVNEVRALGKAFASYTSAEAQKEKTTLEILESLKDNLQTHHDVLYGFFAKDNGEWHPGIIQLQVDVIKANKKKEKNIGIIWGTALAAILSSAGTFIFSFFTRGNHPQ